MFVFLSYFFCQFLPLRGKMRNFTTWFFVFWNTAPTGMPYFSSGPFDKLHAIQYQIKSNGFFFQICEILIFLEKRYGAFINRIRRFKIKEKSPELCCLITKQFWNLPEKKYVFRTMSNLTSLLSDFFRLFMVCLNFSSLILGVFVHMVNTRTQ